MAKPPMIEVRRTAQFDAWFERLRDKRAQVIIGARLVRIRAGNVGDVKALGGGIAEVRIDYGPGYRLYVVRRGGTLIVLLCGGDKEGQDRDIMRAKALARTLSDQP